MDYLSMIPYILFCQILILCGLVLILVMFDKLFRRKK